MNSEPSVAGIPQMGYGTWNRPGDEAYNGVIWALEAGCRHIDTAQGYDNEQEVARGIKASGVSRDDIFITTKVKPENFGPGKVVPSVRESLEKLGTHQVDLLRFTGPRPMTNIRWKTMLASSPRHSTRALQSASVSRTSPTR